MKKDNNIIVGYGKEDVGKKTEYTKTDDDGSTIVQWGEVVGNYELEKPKTKQELDTWIPKNVHLKSEHPVREKIEELQDIYL